MFIDLIHTAAMLNPELGWGGTGCLRCTGSQKIKQIKTRIDFFITAMSTGDNWSQNLKLVSII
jgi:hypothetical protein